MSANKALCIGINYHGTEYALRGCINDADDWAKFLGANGFAPSVLSEAAATRKSVLFAMAALIKSLTPGSVGVITYSGHGTWIPDVSGDEPDGRDEALVPFDVGDDGTNLIIDDELKALFSDIPKGAKVVFIPDCCHSGTIFRFFGNGTSRRKVRFLPPAHFLKDGD